MSASSVERLKLEMGLRHAVEREEMVLFYQPQTSSRTGEIVGVEALVRWRHPEMGIVPPTNFIPLAEETGLIIPIGKWILEQACRQGKIWADRGHDLRMSVNISARQFEQNDLGAMIEAITRETGFDARMLDVELTESAMMSRGDAAISLMAGLKDLGVQLAVDDFGTGYSSLSYLRHFPLDILKVDRSFVRGIESNEVDIAIIRAVVDLAHAIGLTVVAEGVETKTQSALLQELGCDVLQGYLFSPPLPVDDIDRLLARLDNIEIEDDNRVQSLAA
jgi:EAL domain-containing protein (putative c-di-GMP-specific phosphodiesterase class I)